MQGDESSAAPGGVPDRLSRRRFLQTSAVVGAGVAAPAILAACGGGSGGGGGGPKPSVVTTKAAASKVTGTPSRGGTLRIGMVGNGPSETYNPALMNVPIDALHGYCVFDPLIRVAPNYKTEPGLAVRWEPNQDATEWEIHLRDGVTWHDGKPLTADDVIYTLRQMGDPAHLGNPAVQNVRLNDLGKRGDLVVSVPLKSPNSRLYDLFVYFNSSFVVQDGAKDFNKPVGTGPYKLESFKPGQRSVLSANRDYWDDPYPYPDELQIISIDDETARVNALQSGQVDLISPYPLPQAKTALTTPPSGYEVVIGAPGRPMNFYMRCDKAPFTDVRVRQAMKFIVDRDQMINTAFAGIGSVANDLMGTGLPLYDSSLPQRTQDIEQAKALLKAAGQSDLRVTLTTSPAFFGMTEAATVFAQQAKAAGVDVKVAQVQPSQYLNPTLLWLKLLFGQDVWPVPSLQNYYAQALLSDSALNETHFADAKFDALYARATAATEQEEQQALWAQLQKIQFEQGGNIVWSNQQSATAARDNVRGLYGTGSGSGWMMELNDFNVWRWGLA